MQDEKMKMVEGLKKLKDAIENFVDNMELDKAEEEMKKPKKKKGEKEAREEDE